VSSFVADTNVLVAAISDSHVHHERASADLRARSARGDEMILAAHSLVECYSTLTRMPPAQRLSPPMALRAIRQNYIERGRIAGLTVPQYLALLESAPRRVIMGGRIYDAAIAEVAEVAGADEIVTFNLRDFTALVSRVRVAVPPEV
jgi:predicted nucleic acid-binding protein